MLGRAIKSTLPIASSVLKPLQVNNKQVKQKLENYKNVVKTYYDRGSHKLPPLKEGDNVMIRSGKVWKPGIVLRKHHFIVKSSNGNLLRRNKIFLRKSSNKFPVVPIEGLMVQLYDGTDRPNDPPNLTHISTPNPFPVSPLTHLNN